MIDLSDYPRIEIMTRGSSRLGTLIVEVFGLCLYTKRHSGRLVMQHFLETAEITSWYADDLVYVMVAVLHDIMEDLGISFKDVERIGGKDGVRVTHMVETLTKRNHLKDREERDREYLNRLSKGIERDPGLGIIKAADRLSNLTDLYALPPEKRRAIATQTLTFYVPMAIKLGVPGLANALKELSMIHVDGLLDLRMAVALPRLYVQQ